MIGLPSLRALDGGAGASYLAGSRAGRYALRFRSFGGAGSRGDWPESNQRGAFHLPFAPRRQIEDPSVGPRWIRTMVQATRGGSFQTAPFEGRDAFGGVAGQRAGDDS